MKPFFCVGVCLANIIVYGNPTIAVKPLFPNTDVYKDIKEGLETAAAEVSAQGLYRFRVHQDRLSINPSSSEYSKEVPNENLYVKERLFSYDSKGNDNEKEGIPDPYYREDKMKENSWTLDNRKAHWWKNYPIQNQNVHSMQHFSQPKNLERIISSSAYAQPYFENKYRDTFINKATSRYNAFMSNNNLPPSVLEKYPESSFWKNNDEKSQAILNSEHGFVPISETKFPEKVILSRVYNMIKGANSLKQLDDTLRSKAQTNKLSLAENEELLPEAQRRYADEYYSYTPEKSYYVSERQKWDFQNAHFTTLSVGTLMLFLILIVMVLALRVHMRNREKTSQEWINHPVVQPATATSDPIQPNFKHILHPDHLNSEPIRIKAKGLLERRGSNTSLTIDLGPCSEGSDVVFSPSRECTPEDFLMTAGSRMSRKQLRLCLRDTKDVHAEFWQIPTNYPDKCSVPGAAAKNRYRTVLPNEDTRVVLHKAPPDSPETPASQYINANYIRGYDGEERAYIATQGPLAHTVEDLWLLVLQERSPAVVMITRLKEKGRVKCEPYIPSYAATYGSIHVTVKQVIQKNGYTIRQIYLQRGDEVHTTLHFWFTSWPDHKAPSSARHLLAMASEVEASRKESRGPVVVHCSAGIGRTGCFVAVSIGRIQLLEEDCVDILSIVCQMRLDRGGMVQTAEQYEFIHRALALFEASLPSTASAE